MRSQDLIDEAKEATGLDSFGDGVIDEPLSVLTRSIEEDARLDEAAYASARSQLVGILQNRLVAQEFFEARPEIGKRELGSPIVMLAGSARTGTTLLHRLLDCDPELAAMKAWQTMSPMPPRGTRPGDDDPRAESMRAQFAAFQSPIHPLEADGAEEEVFYLQEAFACLLFELNWSIPSYERWLRTADLTFAYRFMEKLVHLNEWRNGAPAGMPRVMKSPQYGHDLHIVVRAYPGAKILFTHRDPLKAVGSYLSLFRGTRPGTYPGLDDGTRSRERLEMLEYEVGHVARVRTAEPADRFHDVLYVDLMKDPIATVGGIYDWLGRPLKQVTIDGIRRWLDDNPQGRGGRHAYTLGEFGLDENDVESRFADYRDRFKIPRE